MMLRIGLLAVFAAAASLGTRRSRAAGGVRPADSQRPDCRRHRQPVVCGRCRRARRSHRRRWASDGRDGQTRDRRARVGRGSRLHRSAHPFGPKPAERRQRREQSPSGRDGRRDRREHVRCAARRIARREGHVDRFHRLLAGDRAEGHLHECHFGGLFSTTSAGCGRIQPWPCDRRRSSIA